MMVQIMTVMVISTVTIQTVRMHLNVPQKMTVPMVRTTMPMVYSTVMTQIVPKMLRAKTILKVMRLESVPMV